MLDEILKQLDNHDWDKLKTSYGTSASDVPKEIRDVLSDEDRVRWNAGRNLWYDLVSDSFILAEVAPVAAPIMIDLIKLPSISEEARCEFLFILGDLSSAHTNDMKLKKEVQKIIRNELGLYLQFLALDGTALQEFAAGVLFAEGNFPPSEYPQLKEIYLDLKKRVPEDNIFRKDFIGYDSIWLKPETEEKDG